MDQASPQPARVPANKRIFVEGEVIGVIRILKIRVEQTAYGQAIADVKCTTCGYERPMTSQQLRKHAHGEAKACIMCRNRRNAERHKKPVPHRGCRVCDDCPALRPWGGVCRGCGEPHQMPAVAK